MQVNNLNAGCKWHFSKSENDGSIRYTAAKEDFISSKAINRISIIIFTKENNLRTEVHVNTWNKECYFKIIEAGQNYLLQNENSSQGEYYFNSLYAHFPKGNTGLCDVTHVKNLSSIFGDQLFANTFLERSLVHLDRYENNVNCYMNIVKTLEILSETDKSVLPVVTDFSESLNFVINANADVNPFCESLYFVIR